LSYVLPRPPRPPLFPYTTLFRSRLLRLAEHRRGAGDHRIPAEHSLTTATDGRQETCGAGFIPADGGGADTTPWQPTPLAGIKPAPQVEPPAEPSGRPWQRALGDAEFPFVGPGSSRPTAVGPTPRLGTQPHWPA